MKTQCVCYYRTSSLTNVGEEKGSLQRQQEQCKAYAVQNQLEIVSSFYDEGVSGKLSVLERPKFSDLIDFCKSNHIQTILFEKSDRFSRDLMVQELGYFQLKKMGFKLISASGESSFNEDINSTLIRQMIGVISEYDRKNIVARLKHSRKNKAQLNFKKGIQTLDNRPKCEGRKSYQETNQKLIETAKRLRRKPRNGKRKSYLRISNELYEAGYKTKKGNVFSASQVQRLVS